MAVAITVPPELGPGAPAVEAACEDEAAVPTPLWVVGVVDAAVTEGEDELPSTVATTAVPDTARVVGAGDAVESILFTNRAER